MDSSVRAFVGVDVWNCAGSVLGVPHVSECGLCAYTRVHEALRPCSDVLAVGLTTETQLRSGRETSAVET